MSDIPAFPYADLWGERTIASVANLTRDDGTSFFKVVQKARVKSVTTAFPLVDANIALERLRAGALVGAAVPLPGQPAIGRASCRERVGQSVSISVVAGAFKKKNKQHRN